MEEKNPIQVAGRLFGALEMLIENRSAGLMEISEGLGLNKSTAHRVLNSLIYMGYARQNETSGRYEPSLKIVDLAGKIMSNMDIIHMVRPFLRRLMEQARTNHAEKKPSGIPLNDADNRAKHKPDSNRLSHCVKGKSVKD